MKSSHDLESVKAGALERIDAAERRFKNGILLAAALEAVLLATVLTITDFHDRTHLLVLVTSMMVYSVLAVGLMVLGLYTRLSAERVLQAVALLDEGARRA